MIPFSRLLLACALVWSGLGSVCVAAPIIKLELDDHIYIGTPLVFNPEICWLATDAGAYHKVELGYVRQFRKLPGEFKPLSPRDLAKELRQEHGRDREVQVSGQFVVVAPHGRAKLYGDLLKQVSTEFNGYFSRRNWRLPDCEYPLVVVVYGSKEEFDDHCRKTGYQTYAMLRGFYEPLSNRVLLYDGDHARTHGEISSDVRDTLVHEAIHQLAFNRKLHSRINENPRWLVEGLATVLEAGLLSDGPRDDATSRINRQRLEWFRNVAQKRRRGGIAEFIESGNQLLQSEPLDFYSEAWALTFYLSEQKRPEFVRYLKKIADQSPTAAPLNATEQIAQFQEFFGTDLNWVNVQMLRFIDGLDVR